MRISVIIPAYDSAREVAECVAAVAASLTPSDEIIVVDDGSTDETAAVASAAGARVLRQANRGPAAARNLGAASARGDVLMFVDADVVVAPDAIARATDALATSLDVAAVFGSYDARPRARGLVSQYRNLLHHYVHQHGNEDASTFWAGCGAVRRDAFVAVGGFDERTAWRAIEDIEFGYRLRRAGFRVRLDKYLRGTHLKRWTLARMLRTDLLLRAAPWTRLIRRSSVAPADLNLGVTQRLSVALVAAGMLCLAVAVARPAFALGAAATLALVVALNRELYRFLYRERGLAFAVVCIPLHVLYFLCSGAGFALGLLTPVRDEPRPQTRSVTPR
jgi:glycosyltransferase involved in cell wall biosynthesis